MTREEIIDELCRLRSDIANAGGYVNRTDAQKNRFVQALSEEIQRLQAKPCEDCISRQRALDTFGLSEKSRKYGGDHSGYDTIMLYEVQDALEALPPVNPQPEIIRCGQCKYAEVADSEDSQDGYTCQFHRGSIWFSGSYCSWAERRQDG